MAGRANPDPGPGIEPAGVFGISLLVDLVALGLALMAPVVVAALWRRDVIQPGSLARRGLRDLSPWPWWFWLLCWFTVLAGSAVGTGIAMNIAAATHEDLPELTRNAYLTVGSAVAGIATAMLLVLVLQERMHNRQRAGVDVRDWSRDLWPGLLGFLLIMPVVQATSVIATQVYRVVTGQEAEPLAHDTLQALSTDPANPAVWVLVGGAVLAAPVLEEIAFRVFLQSAALRLIGRAWPAIIFTSILFTLAHVNMGVAHGHWHALAALFVLSIGLGIAYEWTRRPMVPIVMHMVFNAFNVLIVVAGGY